MSLATLIGIAGALATTLAFIPQLFSAGRRSTELSPWMLVIYIAGQALWLTHGLMIGSMPLIAANAVSLVLVSAVAIRRHTAARGGRPRRLRIAIDMDEVMADALAEHVRRYNAAFGASLTPNDLRGRHLEECVPPAHRAATEALIDESFFDALEPLPGCQEVVRELSDRHEVYVATAAMEVPCSFNSKLRWLRRHFPFIPLTNIVYCGDKTIIDADYLIDDRARHFTRFRGQPVLFDAPHNCGETRYPRVRSWAEVRDFFARVAPGAPLPAAARPPAPALVLPDAVSATRSAS